MATRRSRKDNQDDENINEVDDDQLTPPQELLDACNEIRQFWLRIGDPNSNNNNKATSTRPTVFTEEFLRKQIAIVEQRYKDILRVAKDSLEAQLEENRKAHKKGAKSQTPVTVVDAFNLSQKIEDAAKNDNPTCPDDATYDCVIYECRTKLALLYLQRGNTKDAHLVLERLGCKARLSDEIVRYQVPSDISVSSSNEEANSNKNQTSQAQDEKPKQEEGCCFVDNLVSESTLKKLQQVYCPESSTYWTDHGYCVDPPSPYFSYVVDLAKMNADNQNSATTAKSILHNLIEAAKSAAALKYPKVLKEAKYCEIWAHNRPHFSGHQLHFDSDNEGRDGIRHPLATCVFVVSEDAACGGPTLVTTQKLGDVKMAEKGWLCFPKPNRIFFFESSFLHGVLPGHLDAMVDALKKNDKEEKKSRQPVMRRVTLMLAFWKEIEVRRSEKSGAARPFPALKKDSSQWLQTLLSTPSTDEKKGQDDKSFELMSPPPLSHVWIDVRTNKPWSKQAPIVSYEEAFQY